MPKVFALFVTYNPDLLQLEHNIRAILPQIQGIVICNNSSDALCFHDPELLSYCHIIELGENLGIAQAQNIGMRWAFSQQASFVLQLDQDSEPEANMVARLLDCFDQLTQQGHQVGIVGAQEYDKDDLQPNHAKLGKSTLDASSGYFSINQIISSGSLLSKQAFEHIGPLETALFIDLVDFEYCWRLRSHGYLIVKNPQAKLVHKFGQNTKRIFKLVDIIIPDPIRHYYQFRNTLVLLKRSYVPIHWKITQTCKQLITLLLLPFQFSDPGKRFYYIKLGIKDAWKHKLGKIDHV